MRSVTRTLIQEITLVAKALRLPGETIDSDRARRALRFSVDTLGHVEQCMVDLGCMTRIKSVELVACQAELARLHENAPRETEQRDAAFCGIAEPVASAQPVRARRTRATPSSRRSGLHA